MMIGFATVSSLGQSAGCLPAVTTTRACLGGKAEATIINCSTPRGLAPSLFAGRNLPRAERVGEPRLRRAGLERLLLIRMRRPARQPDELECRAHAAVIVGKALRI